MLSELRFSLVLFSRKVMAVRHVILWQISSVIIRIFNFLLCITNTFDRLYYYGKYVNIGMKHFFSALLISSIDCIVINYYLSCLRVLNCFCLNWSPSVIVHYDLNYFKKAVRFIEPDYFVRRFCKGGILSCSL